jgi:hypothetical protein
MREAFLSVIAMVCIYKIFVHLRDGKVEWYGGDAFSPSRKDEPVSYWIMVMMEFAIVLALIGIILPISQLLQ